MPKRCNLYTLILILTTLSACNPVVTINSPDNASQFMYAEEVLFSGSVTDAQGNELSSKSLIWESSVDGQIGTGIEFNKSNLSIGHHEITLTATNSIGISDNASISLMVLSPSGNKVIIESPKNYDVFIYGDEITFSGYATDFDGKELDSELLVWTSDIHGEIGVGKEFTKDDLSNGIHKITVIESSGYGAIIKASFTLSIVSSSEELIKLLSILNSLSYGYYVYGLLPISEDIQIDGPITISTASLKVPESCANESEYQCRHHVGFENKYDIDGIILSSDYWEMEQWNDNGTLTFTITPALLTLSDVILRFRPLIKNTHMWLSANYTPVIQLMPPSDYVCTDNQIRCDIDDVCYDYYSHYCLYCLGLSYEKCECRDEDGIFPDGTECEYHPPGDLVFPGTCEDGECV